MKANRMIAKADKKVSPLTTILYLSSTPLVTVTAGLWTDRLFIAYDSTNVGNLVLLHVRKQ